MPNQQPSVNFPLFAWRLSFPAEVCGNRKESCDHGIIAKFSK